MSSFKDFVNEYKPFLGLLIFGNIENLVLSAQGVIEGANPLLVAGLSLLAVIIWQFIGVFGTKSAMKYSRHIEFTHPSTGERMSFDAKLPNYFESVWSQFSPKII